MMIIEHNGESYIRLSALYEAELYPALMLPFNGVRLPVVVRKLTYAQIRACGDFSLIETMQDIINAKERKTTLEKMTAYAETQYNIVRKALVSPTYDEIMKLTEYDVLRVNAEKELAEVEAMIKELPEGPKRDELEQYYYAVKMDARFILPVDFVTAVMGYALQIDETDIKEVTEEMLYEAAIRAKAGAGNPSDHLPGTFSDFNKVDINNRAWIIYYKRQGKNGGRRR